MACLRAFGGRRRLLGPLRVGGRVVRPAPLLVKIDDATPAASPSSRRRMITTCDAPQSSGLPPQRGRDDDSHRGARPPSRRKHRPVVAVFLPRGGARRRAAPRGRYRQAALTQDRSEQDLDSLYGGRSSLERFRQTCEIVICSRPVRIRALKPARHWRKRVVEAPGIRWLAAALCELLAHAADVADRSPFWRPFSNRGSFELGCPPLAEAGAGLRARRARPDTAGRPCHRGGRAGHPRAPTRPQPIGRRSPMEQARSQKGTLAAVAADALDM